MKSYLTCDRHDSLMRIPDSFPLYPGERIPESGNGLLFPFRAPRFLLDLIDPRDPDDPIRRQIIPRREELDVKEYEKSDPLSEDRFTATPRLVHRYPDRCILKVTDTCALHCRFCFRKGLLGGDGEINDDDLDAAARYLGAHREVDEVLLTGGDPLMLDPGRLEGILAALRTVRPDIRLRVGARAPVALPSRVTGELAALLARFRPLRVSIHCNHRREISDEMEEAVGRLTAHRIPLLSQTVLLKGINDDEQSLADLYLEFMRLGISAYYLFALDPAPGTSHFRVPLVEGLKLTAALRTRLPVAALPVYAVDLPDGGGKIPVDRLKIAKIDDHFVLLTDPSGKQYRFPGA